MICLLAIVSLITGITLQILKEPTQIVAVPIALTLAPEDGLGLYLRGEEALAHKGKKVHSRSEKFIMVSPPKNAVELKKLIDQHTQQNPVDFSQYTHLMRVFYRESDQTPRNWRIEHSVTTAEEEKYPLINPGDMFLIVHWPESGNRHFKFIRGYLGDCPEDIYIYKKDNSIYIDGDCTDSESDRLERQIRATQQK